MGISSQAPALNFLTDIPFINFLTGSPFHETEALLKCYRQSGPYVIYIRTHMTQLMTQSGSNHLIFKVNNTKMMIVVFLGCSPKHQTELEIHFSKVNINSIEAFTHKIPKNIITYNIKVYSVLTMWQGWGFILYELRNSLNK